MWWKAWSAADPANPVRKALFQDRPLRQCPACLLFWDETMKSMLVVAALALFMDPANEPD